MRMLLGLMALGLWFQAGGGGGIDPKQIQEEVQKRVREIIKQAPQTEFAQEGLTVKYRQIPCNPEKLAKGALPPQMQGMDVAALARQYTGLIMQEIGKELTDVGRLTTDAEFKLGEAKIAAGRYRISLLTNEQHVQALALTLVEKQEGETETFAKKSIKVALPKRKTLTDWADVLELKLISGKKSTDVKLSVTFFVSAAASAQFKLPAKKG